MPFILQVKHECFRKIKINIQARSEILKVTVSRERYLFYEKSEKLHQ